MLIVQKKTYLDEKKGVARRLLPLPLDPPLFLSDLNIP